MRSYVNAFTSLIINGAVQLKIQFLLCSWVLLIQLWLFEIQFVCLFYWVIMKDGLYIIRVLPLSITAQDCCVWKLRCLDNCISWLMWFVWISNGDVFFFLNLKAAVSNILAYYAGCFWYIVNLSERRSFMDYLRWKISSWFYIGLMVIVSAPITHGFTNQQDGKLDFLYKQILFYLIHLNFLISLSIFNVSFMLKWLKSLVSVGNESIVCFNWLPSPPRMDT